MLKIKKIGVMSCGKIMLAGYGLFGVFLGAIISLGALLGMKMDQMEGIFLGATVGVLAVILFPIIYGLIGFISGILTAWLFNIVTRIVGGLEIETE